MSEAIASAVVEGVRMIASVQEDKNRYNYYLAKDGGEPARTHICQEETVPGVELNSFTNRIQLDNETHVKVVEHTEYLQKVPAPVIPPTPEELAAERERSILVTKIWAGVVAVGLVVGGVVIAVDRRRKPVQIQEL